MESDYITFSFSSACSQNDIVVVLEGKGVIMQGMRACLNAWEKGFEEDFMTALATR